MEKINAMVQQYKNAVDRLDDALRQEKNEYVRDSAIQRFEFTFDMAWKTLKAVLETEGVRCASPRGCFREAYKQGLLEYEETWISMIEERNRTAHTYKEQTAEEVYGQLPKFLELFKELAGRLEAYQE